MPELPEVEVMRRSIRPHLLGRRVVAVACGAKKLRQPIPEEALRRELLGTVIVEVGRRAKYLQVHTDSGAMLIIHLGMTGTLSFSPAGAPLAKHDHLRLTLDNDSELRYSDSRRFGLIRMLDPATAAEAESRIFNDIGPEPFDRRCSAKYFHQLAATRRVAVKVLLMDSRVVAGVGNIYASESLFRARLAPTRAAGSVGAHAAGRLARSVRQVLREAIEAGGSSLRDYVQSNGELGNFQRNFRVYDREGEPCLGCCHPVLRIVQGARATFYCGTCQR